MQVLFLLILVAVFQIHGQVFDFDNETTEDRADSTAHKRMILPDAGDDEIYEIKTAILPEDKLKTSRRMAVGGSAFYFTGLCLEYAVALPLMLNALEKKELGLYIGSLSTDLLGYIFQISGATRNGVGASLAYDCTQDNGIKTMKNTNWTFYKTGWIFAAVSAVINQINGLGMSKLDRDFASTLSIISISSAVVSDIMWIVAVVNGIAYTRNATRMIRNGPAVSFLPVYDNPSKSFGGVVRYSF